MKKPLVIGLILLLSLTGCKSTNNPPVQYKPDDELVVLAHGLGRSDWAMRYFAQQLKRAHYKCMQPKLRLFRAKC